MSLRLDSIWHHTAKASWDNISQSLIVPVWWSHAACWCQLESLINHVCQQYGRLEQTITNQHIKHVHLMNTWWTLDEHNPLCESLAPGGILRPGDWEALANERFAEAKVTQDGGETTVGAMIQYKQNPIGFVWKCCVALNPMVLLIIIPMKNGNFIGKINPTFSDKPKHPATSSPILTYSADLFSAHVKLIETHWNSTYQAAFLLVPGGAPTCGTTDGDTARINGAMWTGPQNNAWYILVHWYIRSTLLHLQYVVLLY